MSDPYGYCGPECRNNPSGLDDASGDEHQDCPSPVEADDVPGGR